MATKTKTENRTLHIGRMQVSNVLKIDVADWKPDGRHMVVSGPNGSGKSSALNAFGWALGMERGKDLPEVVRHGAAKGYARIELIDAAKKVQFVVERRVTEKGTMTLTVTAGDGSTVAKAQDLLNSLFDAYSLDPGAFIRARAQDQVDDVLQVCEVAPPVSQVQQVTGVEHPAQKDEPADRYLGRLSADTTGFYYDRRRAAGVLAVQKAKALDEQRAILGALPEIEDVPGIAELLRDREGLQRQRDERRGAELALAKCLDQENAILQQLSVRERDLATKQRERDELLARLKRLEDEIGEFQGRVAKGRSVLQDAQADTAKARAAYEAMPDVSAQLAAIDRQAALAEQQTEARAKRQLAQQEFDRVAREADEATKEHARLDLVMTQLRDLRRNLLNGVDLGVPGLEIGDGELRLNGAPFRQASHAEKLRTACAIAFKRNPAIKVLRMDDAEHLDAASQKVLFEAADAYGWECMLAFVRETGALKVEFVEA